MISEGRCDALATVLLARTADVVPAEVPWPTELLRPQVNLWCGATPGPAQVPGWLPVEQIRKLEPADVHRVSGGRHGAIDRLRVGAARARSHARARQAHLDPDHLWSLTSDRDLARALTVADVVLSLDSDTDGALRVCPDLAGGALSLDSTHATPEGTAWVQLRCWREAVDALSLADRTTGGGSVPADGADTGPKTFPAALPPTELRGALRRYVELTGMQSAQRLRHDQATVVLAGLQVVAQRLDRPDLLDAARAHVDLWQGECRRDDDELGELVARCVAGADQASSQHDLPVAVHRLQTALAVALHRVRHCESLRSPLVDRPDEVLAPIWASTTYQGLRDDAIRRPALARRNRVSPPAIGPWIPRVTVLPGAYGAFHSDLVAALERRARVRVPPLLKHPSMRRRQLSGVDLLLLQALRRGEVDVLRERWDSRPDGVDVTGQLVALRTLAVQLQRCDVVFGEWFDASTMWASHLVPRHARMVVRAHGLDVLDPWVHLVDWRGVDRVLATTPALASLLRDLTGRFGAPEPALVLPYRPDLAAAPHPKGADARFTLGMVGWGRQVKDPHFALDLMERDERRRLVLIGPGFAQSGPGALRPYADSLRQRLADPALASRIDIVGRTDDVPAHLAKVGVILSSSRREGWHLGLIEGAASGAVPVVRDWPLLASRDGARTTHPAEWVVQDLDEADARVADLADPVVWERASVRARAQTLQRYDAAPIAQTYRRLILTPGEG